MIEVCRTLKTSAKIWSSIEKKRYLFMTVFGDKLKYKAPLPAGIFDSKQVCQGFHKTKIWRAVFKKKQYWAGKWPRIIRNQNQLLNKCSEMIT